METWRGWGGSWSAGTAWEDQGGEGGVGEGGGEDQGGKGRGGEARGSPRSWERAKSSE